MLSKALGGRSIAGKGSSLVPRSTARHVVLDPPVDFVDHDRRGQDLPEVCEMLAIELS